MFKQPATDRSHKNKDPTDDQSPLFLLVIEGADLVSRLLKCKLDLARKLLVPSPHLSDGQPHLTLVVLTRNCESRFAHPLTDLPHQGDQEEGFFELSQSISRFRWVF